MSDYEELDSFTEAIIQRTRERQKLLNNESDDQFLDLSANDTNILDTNDTNCLNILNDSQSNVDLNESLPKAANTSTERLVEKLTELSPNRRRVPLNQRLNSIAKSYHSEDSENMCYIDEEEDNERSAAPVRSPTKTMRQSVNTVTESPPKKRLHLNERLNQIARCYDDDEVFSPKEVTKTVSDTNRNKTPSKIAKVSPKKPMVEMVTKSENKWDSIGSKSPVKGSPLKRASNERKIVSESPAINESKVTPIVPSVKQIVSNNISEKLLHLGFQKTTTGNVCSPQKLIYNSNDNKRETPVVNGSTSVSAVRKQFEEKPKTQTPETLSLKGKRDLFEKAIEAENEAKSKQYSRKRNAPVVTPKAFVSASNVRVSPKKPMVTKTPSGTQSVAPKQKSSEKLQISPNVSNNIHIRKQLLEERLFGSETTTANAYKKELENRHKELELLKRPMKVSKAEEPKECPPIVDEICEETEVQDNESVVDDETAHQTVCDAFQEIEEYSNEQSDDDNNYDINSQKSESKLISDKNVDIEYESPTKKNRLYPQLDDELNELYPQFHTSEPLDESSPPAKPPRVYEESTQSTSESTPLRTISFYRREQSLKTSTNTTPSVGTVGVGLKDKVNEKYNNLDVTERNRKIKKQIDRLKQEVEEQNRIAGQASQALNLCLETQEFKGSIEHVEAEKVLLVCGQKRIAFLNEIQRLKIKLSDKTMEMDATKGSLTLYNIKIPIKGDFLVARAKGTVSDVHHFISVVYNGPNVFVTNLLNTEKDIKNGTLEFEFGVKLTDLSNEFQVVVHVYDLMTANHQLPHDIKYHIKKTPKKNKNTMKSPSVRSPGGPNAVLSTSFQLIGVLNINLNNYFKNCYKLENFHFNSPLEGNIYVKTDLTVEHNYYREGFFDVRDPNGFWNLRWVVLKGHHLAFYRFPEDVAIKSALAAINLKECVNPTVGVVRLTGMRPNTIALITASAPKTPKDIFTKGGSIPRSRPIKYLMCGENKDNSAEWAQHLTRTLHGIRLWNSDALKPYRHEEFERLLMALD